ncbi:MAG TPA: YdcF family protein [Candidatus Angelobacter sp.]|nr:YdcF family protein [Candidatus Angelobacter sp.]
MTFRPAKHSETGGILVNLIIFLSIVILCAVLYLLRHPIFRFVAESWVVEDPIDKADALIVLSDDNFYADRATRAAELFREGKAPVVVASGRRLRPNAGIAELMEHDLVERGVPRDKILRFAHDGDSTKEEAEALAKLAKSKKWRKAIIVTSNYHTRRARYIFHRVFPQDIETRVASARDGDFDPEHWWEKRKSTKELMREFAGMVVAVWELRHGSEKSETTQGMVEMGALNPQFIV